MEQQNKKKTYTAGFVRMEEIEGDNKVFVYKRDSCLVGGAHFDISDVYMKKWKEIGYI